MARRPPPAGRCSGIKARCEADALRAGAFRGAGGRGAGFGAAFGGGRRPALRLASGRVWPFPPPRPSPDSVADGSPASGLRSVLVTSMAVAVRPPLPSFGVPGPGLAAVPMCRNTTSCWPTRQVLLTTKYRTRPAGKLSEMSPKKTGRIFITLFICLFAAGVRACACLVCR